MVYSYPYCSSVIAFAHAALFARYCRLKIATTPLIKGKKRRKLQEEVWKVTGSTRGVRGNSDGTNAKQNAAVRLDELEAENKALRKREKATRRAANLVGAASVDGSQSPTASKQEKIRLCNSIYSNNRRNQLLMYEQQTLLRQPDWQMATTTQHTNRTSRWTMTLHTRIQ